MEKNEVFKKKGIMLLFFICLQIGLFAQNIKVSGTVSDESGSPIPGVNISVVGTSQGAITGIDGTYTIDVPSDGQLEFKFIGFETQIVEVNNQTVVNIVLNESDTELDQVVVIGYGTQRKEAVTGSVASMGGEELNDVPSSNITQALQGRIAGVEMTQTSSKPGAAMQIRIRGSRSLTADNNPLVVLDGIPFAGSISDINPTDIKSVDILKDASATAIYGSRGANGVILITTNKGQLGQKPKFSYNGYFGMKKIFAKYPMMDGPEFVKLRAAAGIYTNGVDESDDVNTDWQDLYFGNGMVTSHDLGVSGGTEQGRYTFGMGYLRDEAVMPEQNYNRFSMRGSLDQKVGEYFRFGFTTNNNYAINNGNDLYSINNVTNLGLYGVLSLSPIIDPYNADGTFKRGVSMPIDNQFVYSREIIENLGDGWIDQTKTFASYNSIYGELKVPGIEGLKYRVNIGLDYRQSNTGQFTGRGVFNYNEENESAASLDNRFTTHWAIENLLTYDRTFAEKHQLNVVALYSAEQTKYNRSNIAARDVPADHLQFYNLGQAPGDKLTIDPKNQDYQLSGLISWMGRAMYSYDNRYMLTVTVRSDGSSRLAEGHKWHTYPAISAGWNIANESFMEGVSFINMLKLRLGYGQTSNQAVSPYSTLGRLATRPYNFGPSTYATGYYVSELPNPSLGWEYSKTMNFGLDFALLKNRLSGTLEYYVTNTEELLFSLGLPPTSGVSSYTANIGKTQNKGFELSLNGVILDNLNGWTWEAGINLYANRNKIIELASGQKEDKLNYFFVGHPINVIYDYEKIGLWQEGDPYLDILEPGGNAGMIKVKYTGDYNPDGSPTRQINTDDRQVLDLEPDFMGGFNTRVAYKGFDLNIVGAFKSGGILISTLYSSNGYLNMMTGRRGNVKVDYWTPENTGAKYPAPNGILSGDNPKYGSTLGYFDATYLKIRTISLGYNFNQKWMKNSGIDNLRIYFTVQNPFVMFSPYKKESGMDPETNSLADDRSTTASPLATEGLGNLSLNRLPIMGVSTPSTRNFLFGINLKF